MDGRVQGEISRVQAALIEAQPDSEEWKRLHAVQQALMWARGDDVQSPVAYVIGYDRASRLTRGLPSERVAAE